MKTSTCSPEIRVITPCSGSGTEQHWSKGGVINIETRNLNNLQNFYTD